MNKISQTNINYRISNLGERLDIPCGNSSRASIQFSVKHGNTWSTAVIAVRCSNDNDSIIELPTTLTASGETRLIVDVSDVGFLHLVVTTAEGTTSDIHVSYILTDYQSS
jgi:deoxyhypusine synthase